MKRVMVYLIVIIVVILVCVFGINAYVKISTKNQIIQENEYDKLSDIDCIIVLGAGVWGDKPSHMLEDRLLEGIKLYENNVSSKIIMSGDHGKEDYDEVNIMKNYTIEKECLRRIFLWITQAFQHMRAYIEQRKYLKLKEL